MGMEKYMGYQAKEPVQRPERLLPEFKIGDTVFIVDIISLEMRQADNLTNRMPIIGAKEEMGLTPIFFDTQTKNHYAGDTKMPSGIPNHVIIVFLPPLKDLDPIGFARQQGLPDDYYDNRRAVKQEAITFSKQGHKEKNQQGKPRKAKGIRL